MKLRITKGRIAVAVVLLPVLYLLGIGPMLYALMHLGLNKHFFVVFYGPGITVMHHTPLWQPYEWYLSWWM